jgi:tetratricopeptide (TPR) repeat protein
MIYEQYSGSDSSKGVAKILAKLDAHYDELSADERIAALQEALRLESDPNWKGYLLSRVGAAYELDRRLDEAASAYTDAVSAFDPLAGNFVDVVETYCLSFEGLIRRRLTDDEYEPGKLAAAAISFLAFADMTDIEGSVRAMVFAWFARSLTSLGYRTGDRALHELALPVALRAHHMEPQEPSFLRELVYCYFNLRNADKCSEAFSAFMEVAEPGEARDHLITFMRDRFVEIARVKEPGE